MSESNHGIFYCARFTHRISIKDQYFWSIEKEGIIVKSEILPILPNSSQRVTVTINNNSIFRPNTSIEDNINYINKYNKLLAFS
jgi:hypothetical protein